MPRSIQVAAIQMDATPAPTAERLQVAEKLIQEAATQGAKLVILPSAFNTGKRFDERNYEVTERLSDATMQWMLRQAMENGIHLAGSLMLVDKDDTYNTAFLIAPDGMTWRYDQQYPYLWERVFYRDGRGITVADTSLGKIGMMIGWDAAHSEIWERYAAKIDLMLVMNDALDLERATLRYKDGTFIDVDQFGFFANRLALSTTNYLYHNIEAQSRWMSVPIVCVGASGEFTSILPAPFFSVHGLLLGRPNLWERADSQYSEMQLLAPFQRNTRILSSAGDTIARIVDEGDRVLVSTIHLADKTPLPLDEPQPEMTVPEWSRAVIDLISAALLTLSYRRGVRRQWGARMAPMDANTTVWLRLLFVVAGIVAVLSRVFFSKRR